MNTHSDAMPEFEGEARTQLPARPAQPFRWSVQRELWENRSLWIAPLAVACLSMFGYLLSLLRPSLTPHGLEAIDPSFEPVALAMPYTHVAMLLALTGLIVSFFYCLDALHGERRDRSILFWKSLPVSDRTAVLAKASIPLAVVPLLVFTITIVMQWSMLLLSSLALAIRGGSVAIFWRQLPLFQLEVGLLYTLVVIALWHAPMYAWLLLVSGWSRRTPFLWAVLPPMAVALVELIAFHSTHFGSLLLERIWGFTSKAFALTMPDGTEVDAHFIPLRALAPGQFLTTPGLWIGLVFAIGFLAAAIRLRRDREPI